MSSTGISVGLNRGFPVTKHEVGARPSNSKARLSKRTRMVRDLVSEVVGMSPYERRLLDMLKTGGAGSEKRMYKFAKRRLGTHRRALKKRDQVKEAYGKIRARAAVTH
uniref:60S ribosomal protein L36 n=1 Tax=Spumella elongata TaxID=89044 RepID=A0A7S3MED9_9STRA|eukprot:CAMPEP_0184966838 /NCGR_PEP_ID=MMETSP1098-20130426/388_1 /TAXON_ID=89044 /ORGANISM="Spumella elongata, Strain CCAP 955/1" /LENGTH=107 /DNA_ID=CAMNT_0027488187 /DNA_START=31 /DNA_END=354 /DNA_ORIENTATION=+